LRVYQDFGGTVDRGIWVTTYQGQSNLTSTRGSHTWRGGVDVQMAQRTARDGAGNMGTFVYDHAYTRAADTTNVFPAQQIGLSLAAFMLGHAVHHLQQHVPVLESFACQGRREKAKGRTLPPTSRGAIPVSS
jgi:hypothetical protein